MIRFVAYLLVLAAVLYVFFWAVDRRSNPRTPTRPPAGGPIGPDDDDAFLLDLDRKRRRHDGDPPPTSQEKHDHPE